MSPCDSASGPLQSVCHEMVSHKGLVGAAIASLLAVGFAAYWYFSRSKKPSQEYLDFMKEFGETNQNDKSSILSKYSKSTSNIISRKETHSFSTFPPQD